MENLASVKVLKTAEELEGIRESWESWPGNRDSEIDSYLTFLRFSPAAVRPHVIAITREGKLDAVFVGRIDDGKVICRIGYWQFSVPAKTLAFVNGALRGCGSAENCDLVVDSILHSLSAGEADAAYLTFLREDSRLCDLAMTRPGILFRRTTSIQASITSRRSCRRQSKVSIRVCHRKYERIKNGRRRSSQSSSREPWRFVAFEKRLDIEELAVVTEQLASKSYQRGIGAGFFDTPAVRAQLRLKAERGWLRGYVLYLAGKPCAFWSR